MRMRMRIMVVDYYYCIILYLCLVYVEMCSVLSRDVLDCRLWL